MAEARQIITEMGEFEFWLRTGRRRPVLTESRPIERKSNPWHDPQDGRFTFRGSGVYYGAGGQAQSGGAWQGSGFKGGAGGSFGGAGAAGTWNSDTPAREPQSSQHNQNTPAPKSEFGGPEKQPLGYVVRPGDSLTQLARKGDMTVAQLVAANDLSLTAKLQVGQKLVLPTPLGADVNQKGPADQAGWRSFERMAILGSLTSRDGRVPSKGSLSWA